MTELEAINRMLSAIGQAPVNALETASIAVDGGTAREVQTNPDVAICQRTLRQVSQEVQSEGWTFNTYYNEKVSPDADGRIVIRQVNFDDSRDYCLQMDLSYNTVFSRDKDTIAKVENANVCLYDKTNLSFNWGSDPVEVDKVMYLADLSGLPPAAANYIVNKASARASMRTVGDGQQYSILKQEEEYARVQLQQYETTQGDYTFFGHPKGANYYNSYQPFHTLSR